MEFHPYTLKDYKELVRNPVVLGHLGPNVGTKEWEEKKQKMKKMMNYSNNVNKEHKGIRTLKKDTPKEEVEKKIKEKIENSARFKTYEYGKLNNNNNVINNDMSYEDLIKQNEEFKSNIEDIREHILD